MMKKTVALLICAGLVLSAAGCSGSGSGASSAQAPAVEETAAEDAEKAGEAAAGEAASAAQTLVDKDALEASAEIETGEIESAVNALEAAPGGTVSGTGSAGEENYDAVYEYVNVKIDGSNLIVIPNGTVNDDTVIYNEKTLGALCDYIDSNVLDGTRTINRKFLHGLVSTQVIDPKMMSSYEQFNRTMVYCLTIANEFYSIDVTLNDLILDTANNTKQVFEVTAEGKDDSWILDGHEKKFYLNGGSTEYTSSMFDSQTLAVWSFVLDDFFGVK